MNKKYYMKENIPTLQEFVNKFIYDPYHIKLDVTTGKDTITLTSPDWFVILNTEEGSFFFQGIIRRMYDIDRVSDIRDKFGNLFTIKNLNEYFHK